MTEANRVQDVVKEAECFQLYGDDAQAGRSPSAAPSPSVLANLRVRKALAELVRLKDIKVKFEAIPKTWKSTDPMDSEYMAIGSQYHDDYLVNVDSAWQMARAALAELPVPPSIACLNCKGYGFMVDEKSLIQCSVCGDIKK